MHTARTLRGFVAAFSLAVLAAPLTAGPPFDVDDPGTATLRHYNVYLTWASNRCPEGNISRNTGLALAYGLSHNVEIGIGSELAAARGGGASRSGWGDTSVCVKWRFQEEGPRRPQWAAAYQVTLPTGGDLGADRTVHTAYLCGAKEIGPGTLYTNLGGNRYGGGDTSLLYGLAYPIAVSDEIALGPQIHGTTSSGAGGPAELAWGIGGTYQAGAERCYLVQVGRSTRGHSDINLFFGAVFDLDNGARR